MKFVQANAVTIACKISGNPRGKALLFANSLGTDLRIWDDVVPHFEDDFCVVRYDKRGHGLSDCPPAPYSIHDHALDLVGLLDALDIEKAVLVGISVGGMIAQDVAATWPERVEKVVLCDTAAKIGTAAFWNDRVDKIREHGMEAMADPILRRWFAPAFAQRWPAAYAGYGNMLSRTPVEGYIGTCEAIRNADLTTQTGTILAPTLVLCGTADQPTPPVLVKTLLSVLPNGRYHEIADAGHLPCIEQPEEMAKQIKQFL